LEGPYWNWHVGDLIEIDAAGNGLTLVKTDVYRKIEKDLGGPWYSTEYGSFPGVKETPFNNTEDLYFYWKAKKAGYKIWADTSVQAFHYDKTSNVMYNMPANAPQANPAWEIKPKGSKLIADIGSGPISPYMADEGEVISFDIREDVHPDVICDVRYLPVPNETFDIVFSSHTLEHFGWVSVDKVLKEWSRILKIGGELRIVVPNARYAAQRVLEDKIHPYDFWVFYGEQDYPKNFHGTMFTPNLLRDLVASIGVYDPESIQIKEGDFQGPPNPNSWNLQVKATKIKNIELDNIAPEGMEPGKPPPGSFYPVRLYDQWTERPATPEEITAELKWLGAYDKTGLEKKKSLLQSINGYPVSDSDRAYFMPEASPEHREVESENKKSSKKTVKKELTPTVLVPTEVGRKE
jgi:predicted SAM-dependent methyltransferase